jgi:hypothetical protein
MDRYGGHHFDPIPYSSAAFKSAPSSSAPGYALTLREEKLPLSTITMIQNRNERTISQVERKFEKKLHEKYNDWLEHERDLVYERNRLEEALKREKLCTSAIEGELVITKTVAALAEEDAQNLGHEITKAKVSIIVISMSYQAKHNSTITTRDSSLTLSHNT